MFLGCCINYKISLLQKKYYKELKYFRIVGIVASTKYYKTMTWIQDFPHLR